MKNEETLSYKETYTVLKIDRRTLQRWIKSGKLNYVSKTEKRFYKTDIEQILNYRSPRDIANESGAITYTEDKPCVNGHISVRYTYDGRCKECLDNKNKNYKENNPEKVREIKKNWYDNNIKEARKNSLDWYHNNKEKAKESTRKRYKLNPKKFLARTAKRRAKKKQALPKWANLDKIKEIYLGCPKELHVDHIIPLVSSEVCGLHVENNLQYLTKEENNRKGNKLLEEYKNAK